ncbi:hypothetical protein [Mycoplasma sp. 2634B]|uniref:hypothetical protein n=1 Tax=Mycoplasma sp. 2634B TaxID=3401692 RepID=UPI003AB0F085
MENTVTNLECASCGATISKTQRTCKYCAQPNKFYESAASRSGAGSSSARPKMDFTSTANYTPVPIQSTSNGYASGTPVRSKNWISWGLFIVLLILFWPAALIYLIVCAASNK